MHEDLAESFFFFLQNQEVRQGFWQFRVSEGFYDKLPERAKQLVDETGFAWDS